MLVPLFMRCSGLIRSGSVGSRRFRSGSGLVRSGSVLSDSVGSPGIDEEGAKDQAKEQGQRSRSKGGIKRGLGPCLWSDPGICWYCAVIHDSRLFLLLCSKEGFAASLGVWGILWDYGRSRVRFRVLSLPFGSVLHSGLVCCAGSCSAAASGPRCWFRLVSFGSVLAAAGLPGRVLLSKASKNAGIMAAAPVVRSLPGVSGAFRWSGHGLPVSLLPAALLVLPGLLVLPRVLLPCRSCCSSGLAGLAGAVLAAPCCIPLPCRWFGCGLSLLSAACRSWCCAALLLHCCCG